MIRYYFLSFLYLVHCWILHTRRLVAYSPQYNLKFNFITKDVMGRLIYKRGLHEQENTDFLLSNLTFEEGDVWFDIGANIGWYSQVITKQVPQKITAYAFEPDPINYSLLEENIKINNIASIVCVNKALSDQTEVKKLYLYPEKNLGRHSLLPINDSPGISIETISLDQYISENDIDIKKIKFIKMDIEGYEYIALSGAKAILDHVPFLLCEFSPNYMKKGGIISEDLLQLMDHYHYSPH